VILSTLLLAFALMLVLEGVLPLIAPALWRATFRRLIEMQDGQIRFVGMASVAAGALLMLVAESL
jgi:uncharacterized protein YjeT (DUF2065 family)